MTWYLYTYIILFLFKIIFFRVASDQNLETTEGLQKAAKKLQAAAGIFAHLRDHAVAALQVCWSLTQIFWAN